MPWATLLHLEVPSLHLPSIPCKGLRCFAPSRGFCCKATLLQAQVPMPWATLLLVEVSSLCASRALSATACVVFANEATLLQVEGLHLLWATLLHLEVPPFVFEPRSPSASRAVLLLSVVLGFRLDSGGRMTLLVACYCCCCCALQALLLRAFLSLAAGRRGGAPPSCCGRARFSRSLQTARQR